MPVKIELFGSQGSLITKLEPDNQISHTFNISVLPAGLYFIRVVAGQEVRSARIIKN
jgi:hypothetical protein